MKYESTIRRSLALMIASFTVVVAVACTGSPPAGGTRALPSAPLPSALATTSTSTPSPGTSASVDAGTDAAIAEAPEPPGPAWTDPEHVAALTKDCAYAPAGLTRPKNVDRDFFEGSPLACSYGLYGQSCSVDPCYDEQKDVCGAKCEKTCDGCGQGCTTACKSCKKDCKKDDTNCLAACAISCAGCRQECVLAKDRCSSGTCAKRYKECKVELQTKWDTSGCGKGCKAYYACTDACPEGQGGGSPCAKACEKHVKVCSAGFRGACLFNGGLYGPVGED